MAVTGAPELLIVMGANASPEQVDDVVARLEEAGCGAVVTPGREATVIGAIGERELLAALPLEGYAGVEQVLPILKPYKLVSRELSPDPTVIEARGRRIGDGYFGFIAGPCSVESREQTLETARAVAACGVTMLRGGAFKPLGYAIVPVRVPGARRRGTRDPQGGARGDGTSDRHRADGSPPRRAGGRDDRRHPDRRAQHGELLAPRRGRARAQAGAAEARPPPRRSKTC